MKLDDGGVVFPKLPPSTVRASLAEAVAALDQHGECQELEGIETELERISSEVAPP